MIHFDCGGSVDNNSILSNVNYNILVVFEFHEENFKTIG